MKLKEWLIKNNMTQSELSMRLNINRCLIYMWKNRVRRIGPRTLKSLIKLTNGEVCSTEDVVDG
jgi:transcriptional regulator with XRE-family HTH domain